MASTAPNPQCLIIADSEVIVRNVLSDYLRLCGYKVIDAASTDEVVTLLKVGAVMPDIVLLAADIAGTMGAFALRQWIGQEHPGIAVVMAGNVDAAARAAGDLCDQGPHLKRPYDPQTVLAHIRQLLAAATR